MIRRVKELAASLIILLLVDGVWLYAMRSFYGSLLGHLMRDGVLLWAGIAAWALIAVGVVFFTLDRPWWQAFLFGVVLYGVYDFTNLATIRDWPLLVVAVDVMWGGVVCTVVRVGVQKVLPRG